MNGNIAPDLNTDQNRDTGQGNMLPAQESEADKTAAFIENSPRFSRIKKELVARAEAAGDLPEDIENQNLAEVHKGAFLCFKNIVNVTDGSSHVSFRHMLCASDDEEEKTLQNSSAKSNTKKVQFSKLLQEIGNILMTHDEDLKIEGIHFRTLLPLLLFEGGYLKLGVLLSKNTEENDTVDCRARVLSALLDVGKQHLLKSETGYMAPVSSWELSNANEYYFIEKGAKVFAFSLSQNSGVPISIKPMNEEGAPKFKILSNKNFHFLVLFYELPHISLPRYPLKWFPLWRHWMLRVNRLRKTRQENCVDCQKPLNNLEILHSALCPADKKLLRHCWECLPYKSMFLDVMARSYRNYMTNKNRDDDKIRKEYVEEDKILNEENSNTEADQMGCQDEVDNTANPEFDCSDNPSTSSSNVAPFANVHASSTDLNFEYMEQYDEYSGEHFNREKEHGSIHNDVSETVSDGHQQEDNGESTSVYLVETEEKPDVGSHARGLKREFVQNGSNQKNVKIHQKKRKIDEIASQLISNLEGKSIMPVEQEKSDDGVKCNSAGAHPEALVLPDATESELPAATREEKDECKKMDDTDVMETSATKEDNMSSKLKKIGQGSSPSVNINKPPFADSKSTTEEEVKEDKFIDVLPEPLINGSDTRLDDRNEKKKMDVDDDVVFPSEHSSPNEKASQDVMKTQKMHQEDKKLTVRESKIEKCKKKESDIDFYQLTDAPDQRIILKDGADNEDDKKNMSMDTAAHPGNLIDVSEQGSSDKINEEKIGTDKDVVSHPEQHSSNEKVFDDNIVEVDGKRHEDKNPTLIENSKFENNDEEEGTTNVDQITDVVNQNANVKDEAHKLENEKNDEVEDGCRGVILQELGSEKSSSVPVLQGNETFEDNQKFGTESLVLENSYALMKKDQLISEKCNGINSRLAPEADESYENNGNAAVPKFFEESPVVNSESAFIVHCSKEFQTSLTTPIEVMDNHAIEDTHQINKVDIENDRKALSGENVSTLYGLDIIAEKDNGTTKPNESDATSSIITSNHNTDVFISDPVSPSGSGMNAIGRTNLMDVAGYITPSAPIVENMRFDSLDFDNKNNNETKREAEDSMEMIDIPSSKSAELPDTNRIFKVDEAVEQQNHSNQEKNTNSASTENNGKNSISDGSELKEMVTDEMIKPSSPISTNNDENNKKSEDKNEDLVVVDQKKDSFKSESSDDECKENETAEEDSDDDNDAIDDDGPKTPSGNNVNSLFGLDISAVNDNGTTEPTESEATSPMIASNQNTDSFNLDPIPSPGSGVSAIGGTNLIDVAGYTTLIAPIVENMNSDSLGFDKKISNETKREVEHAIEMNDVPSPGLSEVPETNQSFKVDEVVEQRNHSDQEKYTDAVPRESDKIDKKCSEKLMEACADVINPTDEKIKPYTPILAGNDKNHKESKSENEDSVLANQKKDNQVNDSSESESSDDDDSDSSSDDDSNESNDDDDETGRTGSSGASGTHKNLDFAADQYDRNETKSREQEKHDDHPKYPHLREGDKRTTDLGMENKNSNKDVERNCDFQSFVNIPDPLVEVEKDHISNTANMHRDILGSNQKLDDQSNMHPHLIEKNVTSVGKSHQNFSFPILLPLFGLSNASSKDTEVCSNSDLLPLLRQLSTDDSNKVEKEDISKDMYPATDLVNCSHDYSTSSSNGHNIEPKPTYTISNVERINDVPRVNATVNVELNNEQVRAESIDSGENPTFEPFVLTKIIQPEMNNAKEVDNNNRLDVYEFNGTKQVHNFTHSHAAAAFSGNNDEKDSIVNDVLGNCVAHQLNTLNEKEAIEDALGNCAGNQKQELKYIETRNSDSLSDKLNQTSGNYDMDMNSSSKSETCLMPLHNIVAERVDDVSEGNNISASFVKQTAEEYQPVNEDDLHAKHLIELDQNPRPYRMSGFSKGVSEGYLVRKQKELNGLSKIVAKKFEEKVEAQKKASKTNFCQTYEVMRVTIAALTTEEKMKSLNEIKTRQIEKDTNDLKTLEKETEKQLSNIWQAFEDTAIHHSGADELALNRKRQSQSRYVTEMKTMRKNTIERLEAKFDGYIKEWTEDNLFPRSSTNDTQHENENGSLHGSQNVTTLTNNPSFPKVNLENRNSNPQNSEHEAQNHEQTIMATIDIWYNTHVSGINNVIPMNAGSSTHSPGLNFYSPGSETSFQGFSSNKSADIQGELQQQNQQSHNGLQPSQSQQQQEQQQIPLQHYQMWPMQPQEELAMMDLPKIAMQQEGEQRAIAGNTAQDPIAPHPVVTRRRPGRPKKPNNDPSAPSVPSKRARPNLMEANQVYPQFEVHWQRQLQNGQQSFLAQPVPGPVPGYPASQNGFPGQQYNLQHQQMASNQMNHAQDSSQQSLRHFQTPLTHYPNPPQNQAASNTNFMGNRFENPARPSHGPSRLQMPFRQDQMQHSMTHEEARQMPQNEQNQTQMYMNQHYGPQNHGHPGVPPTMSYMCGYPQPGAYLNYQQQYMQNNNNAATAQLTHGNRNEMQIPQQSFQGGYPPAQH